MFQRMGEKKCPECFGTGIDRLKSGFVKVPCKNCDGKGVVSGNEGHPEE